MTTAADGADPHPDASVPGTPVGSRRRGPRRRARGVPVDRGDRLGRGSIARVVVIYMLVALGAFVLCGVGLALAQRHAALQEAVRDAEVTTTLLATRVVQPELPPTPLEPSEVDGGLDRVVRERVLLAPIDQVRVLDEEGLVVYATDPALVGGQEPLTAGELAALRDATAVAAVDGDDGPDPTRLLGDREGRSLHVGVGIASPSGQSLLLQTRQPYEAVWLTSRTVWLTLLPTFVLALALLYLAKIGFAYRLNRSLHGVQAEREQLLVTALAAADRERTMIASDLHDGVVQGLAGASYTLTHAADRTRSAGQPDVADSLAETARNLRQWVRELRSLIVTVTPPELHSEGLRATLTDLTATLEARGIDVELDVEVGDTLTETSESLIYRVAQEAIRNVIRHAHASRVQLLVAEEDGWVRLQLVDDGQGFDPSAVSARRRGSVGLTLLAALVQQRGGRLRVESAVGDGTSVTLDLPEQAADAPWDGGRPATTGALR